MFVFEVGGKSFFPEYQLLVVILILLLGDEPKIFFARFLGSSRCPLNLLVSTSYVLDVLSLPPLRGGAPPLWRRLWGISAGARR